VEHSLTPTGSGLLSAQILPKIPQIIGQAGEQALRRYAEFFTANLRNPHTRQAYFTATTRFLDFCEEHAVLDLCAIEPIHVAAYIEGIQQEHSIPTAKQHLAAIRSLFDWLVVGQVVPINPALSVRGARYSVTKGKTPVLTAEETRLLLDSCDTSHVVGLRDRALIAMMVYTFARVGAVVQMRVEDYFPQGKRWWVRLHEKGGKEHEMPCHHNLEAYLDEYIGEAGIKEDRKGYLFRSSRGQSRKVSDRPLCTADVFRLVRRRAKAAGIPTLIGCHTFRATGITTYLKNEGTLEKAQFMANHASARTTKLYDRRQDEVSLDEVERIVI